MGRSNVPTAVPGIPNLKLNSPVVALNTWTRLFPWSATAIVAPSGDQAATIGLLKLPLMLPGIPNVRAWDPLPAWNIWTRLFPRSTAAISSPSGDHATERATLK